MSPSTSIHGMWSNRRACGVGLISRRFRVPTHEFEPTGISLKMCCGLWVFEAQGRV